MLASRRNRASVVRRVMEHFRDPSARPSIVVDPTARGVADPTPTLVGFAGPLGRERVVSALPLDPGPALLSPPVVLRDSGPAYLVDPSGTFVGVPAVWVQRMMTAAWTEDTRRL